MTIEGFKRARELDSLINKAKEDKYCLENLATRIEEIKTTQQFKGVAIKITKRGVIHQRVVLIFLTLPISLEKKQTSLII